MRNRNSLFNRVCEFINSVPVGTSYKANALINFCDGYEKSSYWKRSNSNEFYRTRCYQTYLKRAGFIKNVKRGEWLVIYHIPDHVTLSTVEKMIGYGQQPNHKVQHRMQLSDHVEVATRIAKQIADNSTYGAYGKSYSVDIKDTQFRTYDVCNPVDWNTAISYKTVENTKRVTDSELLQEVLLELRNMQDAITVIINKITNHR